MSASKRIVMNAEKIAEEVIGEEVKIRTTNTSYANGEVVECDYNTKDDSFEIVLLAGNKRIEYFFKVFKQDLRDGLKNDKPIRGKQISHD